jgi:CRISPR system Cascade subunit CasE
MTLYLSRLRLSRRPSAQALDKLLNPDEPGRRMDAHHRLLWAAFSDASGRRRDFLWREERAGEFLTLSARPPVASELFDTPDVKEFAPALTPGVQLAFVLRVNATRTVKSDDLAPNGERKRKHHDLVMDRLKPVVGQSALTGDTRSERPDLRPKIAAEVASEWFGRQGSKSGFRPVEVEVNDYSVLALPAFRGPRKNQPQFGILDLAGTLEVTDPPAFLPRLAAGFGRAKAYGCGLMLIRRAVA